MACKSSKCSEKSDFEQKVEKWSAESKIYGMSPCRTCTGILSLRS